MPRRDPWPLIGLVAFFAILFVAAFGERIAPHEPIYFVVEHGRDPRPYDPGLVFPFGSDILGRDLLSLVLAGARTTIVIVVLGGLARVLAGVLLALAAALSRRARIAADALSEIVAAVPATLVVLLVVLVFVRGDTTFLVFVGAILITGWAGPYRVFRTELDRLGHMGFTESAAALGVSRLRIAVRHHLPHLVPLLALNLSQQSVASLVALAELGVLGVFVGTSRVIGIEESMSFVTVGQINRAFVADPPEWGGLLANARSTENLWTTRWVFLVPGIAFALLAVALAAVGLALARRYARRDLVADLRGRGAGALASAATALLVLAAVVPGRYAAAVDWASAARDDVRTVVDPARAFADAGLLPIGGSYTVERDVEHLVRTGAATARSAARDLGVTATVDVPIAREAAHIKSVVGATRQALPSPDGRNTRRAVLVWAVARPDGAGPAVDVAAAVARSIAARAVPVAFVAFDPRIDPDGNADLVAHRLAGTQVSFVVVIDGLTGTALRFRSVNGDVIAALDRYAERVGARHVPTRVTIDPNKQDYAWPGIRPFLRDRSIVMSGTGGAGDLRPDAAATLGYLCGRLALGAEELR